MSLTAPTTPAAVTLTEAKAQLNIELTDTTDDTLISDLILAATDLAEARSGRAYVERELTLTLDAWPAEIRLPSPPLKTATVVIKYDDDAGDEQTLATADYRVDEDSAPARINPVDSWPDISDWTGAIRITYTAGYGDSPTSTPARARRAILLLVAELYANREISVLNTNVAELPLAADALLAPDRVNPDQVTIE